MGFFDRWLGGDPRRDLERAEVLLAKGETERALELARRAVKQAVGADAGRAASMVERARDAAVSKALERAATAVSSEYWEDAAEWVGAALEHVEDPARRGELEERLSELLAKAREADNAAEDELYGPSSAPEDDVDTELDPEVHYHALIGMLSEQVGDLYEDRPAAFRRAYVDLNEGRVDEALAAFEQLAESTPDPVVQLERGRCRLMSGDADGALEDLEAAWEAFGDDPIDARGELSLPGLWAEARLARGEGEKVLERLAALAEPGAGRPSLSLIYAQALLASGRAGDARSFLATAAARFSSQPMFAYLLAGVLAEAGERSAAIECLEVAIAPSCAGGSCKAPAKHLPSLRALASLYLEQDGSRDRVRQLLNLVAQDQGGRLAGEDFALLARFHELEGNPEGAERAAAEAARLLSIVPTEGTPATAAAPSLGGMKPPL